MLVSAESISTVLSAATRALGPSHTARLDAEVLLASVLKVSRSRLYLEPERCLDAPTRGTYSDLISERQSGAPVPYLTGRTEFWSLVLEISRDVLVPRPETELLVEAALALTAPLASPTVIDLGTGSGAIAAAFASERPRAVVIASDRSLAACSLAARNFARLGLSRVKVVASDWLAAFVAESVDLIVANPPYIGSNEAAMLGPELAHEPHSALFAASNGLADLEHIICEGAQRLRVGAHLVVEHGYRQGAAVRGLFARHGYSEVETARDLGGHERMTQARRRH